MTLEELDEVMSAVADDNCLEPPSSERRELGEMWGRLRAEVAALLQRAEDAEKAHALIQERAIRESQRAEIAERDRDGWELATRWAEGLVADLRRTASLLAEEKSKEISLRIRAESDLSAARQRAETAERALDSERALVVASGENEAAALELKRTAYAVLDDVRKVVAETIIPALEAAQKYIPGSEVRNWPPGFRLRDDAMRRLPDALAAARKTLTDNPKAQED